MRRRHVHVGLLLTAALAVSAGEAGHAAAAQGRTLPPQGRKLLHFVERASAWYPGSTFTIVQEKRVMTPSGSYRIVAVERKCENRFLSTTSTWVIDEVARTAWLGTVGLLPQLPAGSSDVAGFLKAFLPDALRRSLRLDARVIWDTAGRPSGALTPFTLEVSTGYGTYRRPAALTADARRIVIGSPLPLDEDPVAYRRKLLHGNKLVMWDHPGADPRVEIVEFSDFECPACKARWSLIREVLDKFGGTVRHGMVNFPLTMIHPWAFRAAAAAWCVAKQQPSALIPLKEQFYSMQRDMTVSQVAPVARDFVTGHGLDPRAFDACFLEKPSLDAVNRQTGLAQDLGVMATPTYFINGFMVQVPDKSWLLPMIQRLAAGQEP